MISLSHDENNIIKDHDIKVSTEEVYENSGEIINKQSSNEWVWLKYRQPNYQMLAYKYIKQ